MFMSFSLFLNYRLRLNVLLCIHQLSNIDMSYVFSVVQCCIQYKVSENCIGICFVQQSYEPASEGTAFIGGMICQYKYYHIVEACLKSTVMYFHVAFYPSVFGCKGYCQSHDGWAGGQMGGQTFVRSRS